MDNPGPFQFQLDGSAFSPLTVDGTYVGDVMSGVAGINYLGLQAQFQYGSSGGATIDAYVQTSFDQGQTWFDVCNFHFTTANGLLICASDTFDSFGSSVMTPTNLSIDSDTVAAGFLGDRFRAVVVVAGGYLGIPILNLTGMAA